MHRQPGARRPARSSTLLLACLLTAGTLASCMVAMVALSGPAHAAAYRYWSYWWVDQGAWSFATAGPASSNPEDGSVEGWRFGITGATGTALDAPSLDPSAAFAQACASTLASEGHKRVAIVIDPGSPAAAPPGDVPGDLVLACASAEESANGYQVLRSITEVRTEDGLVCAIGGYPSTGCAELVPDALVSNEPTASEPTASEPASGQPPQPSQTPGIGPMPLVVAGLAIGAMLGFIWRRRRSP